MLRTALRVTGAGLLALLATVAIQGPAMADTVLTDGDYHAGTTSDVRYTDAITTGWWNAVVTRGYNYDFDLSLKNSAGSTLGSSTVGGYSVDIVAVNGNGTCSGFAGVNDTAVVHPYGPASSTPDSPSEQAFAITRRAGGRIFSVVPKTSPDQYTVLSTPTSSEWPCSTCSWRRTPRTGSAGTASTATSRAGCSCSQPPTAAVPTASAAGPPTARCSGTSTRTSATPPAAGRPGSPVAPRGGTGCCWAPRAGTSPRFPSAAVTTSRTS